MRIFKNNLIFNKKYRAETVLRTAAGHHQCTKLNTISIKSLRANDFA